MKRQGNALKYDALADRWMVYVGSQAYGLHCGECFELHIGDRNIPCRLEYAQQWYVVMDDARFNLRVCDTYRVKI